MAVDVKWLPLLLTTVAGRSSIYEGRSISSRIIFFKRQRLPAGKRFYHFSIVSLGKLTQRSQRFTSRHDARGTEICVSDAEEVQNVCCCKVLIVIKFKSF